ncbi:MAG: CAP domain-containing protein [Streptomycetales bacterium]
MAVLTLAGAALAGAELGITDELRTVLARGVGTSAPDVRASAPASPSSPPSVPRTATTAPETLDPPSKPRAGERRAGDTSPEAGRRSRDQLSPWERRRLTAERAVVLLTNAERAEVGCRPVSVDTRLRAAARGHSADMALQGYFSHRSLEGLTPGGRAGERDYDVLSGENIARGQPRAADAVRAWMRSPGHRQIILNCDARSIGVGVRFGPGGPWWTQMFGYE